MGVDVVIPPTVGEGALDLLDGPAVVAAAVAIGADALHPGFGFLAERAEFASAVDGAGIRWVGPPPAAIAAMGDKAAARRLAASLGVPVIDGYDEPDQSDAALIEAAVRIGPPLLIKPAAGGGGKGMRVVHDLAEFRDALAASRREAMSAFGDDRVVLERHLEAPRHVEVQVLFDGYGRGVHLGERDCSAQRRHQKVLEETPSPAVDTSLRARLAEAALRIAAAVGYASAGTVEFLVAGHDFWFLEMNTRLQVEHPVTELVTGRDLVEDQLRIAAGAELGFEQADVRPSGHAIEVRLYAEDPEAGFLPATGHVAALRWPAGDGIRVDAGIAPGDEVSARFDPLLAKLVAWGPDRPAALDRLTAALEQTLVLGVTTNLRFLRWLVRQPWVLEGDVRVDTLEPAWSAARAGADETPPDDAWRTAARILAGPGDDAWTGGWRLGGASILRLASEGVERRVILSPGGGRSERAFVVHDGVVHVDVEGRSVAFALAPPPDVDAAARRAYAGRGAGDAGSAGGSAQVIAPMPGSVVRVHVRPGAEVGAGDPVATLEAMKMEHIVTAPAAGLIGDVLAEPGSQVVRGQLLAIVEPGPGPVRAG